MRCRPWRTVSLALLASLAGGALVLRARAEQPQREAQQRGLRLRLERAVWLHEATAHGATAALPSMPGAPAPGSRRLAVELSVFNPRPHPLDFTPEELRLGEGRTGTQWPSSPQLSPPFPPHGPLAPDGGRGWGAHGPAGPPAAPGPRGGAPGLARERGGASTRLRLRGRCPLPREARLRFLPWGHGVAGECPGGPAPRRVSPGGGHAHRGPERGAVRL